MMNAHSLNTNISLSKMVKDVCIALVNEESILTRLDMAIGDGDHGLNMRKGCEALIELSKELDYIDANVAMYKMSESIFSHMGGAAGALFGSFFSEVASSLPIEPTRSDWIHALKAGLVAIKKRGKANVGDKTLVDVIEPVCNALNTNNINYSLVADIAQSSCQSTLLMQASRGRAAVLGKRSIDHIDPGAYSCAIVVKEICKVMGEHFSD